MARYCYEGMFLIDSNRYANDPDGTTQSILQMLERCGAEVAAARPWQELKLAYPINNHRRGLYYLACFKMDGSQVQELNRLGKLNESILRQLVIRHPQSIFDAMVEALTHHDGTIHSPEQNAEQADDNRSREEVLEN
ncbi:MAG: 30S ribosomal protein S6 [Planctomycetaceae bacterium]|nr:MAG: 30S ribosomal protein S6 [Planctomycetaceae bacterium]